MTRRTAALVPQEKMDWKADVPAALGQARREGKLLLLQFTVPGRPACQAMEEETLGAPEVVRRCREKFVSARIDVERHPDLFQKTVGGRGSLASCILDDTEDVVSTLAGFAPADDFLRFLDRATGRYPALREAREGAAKRPDDPEALAALGEAYLALDSRRRAEECYEKVVAPGGGGGGDPAWPVLAHERLARIAVSKGQNKEARRHLEEVRRLDPEGKRGHEDRLLLTEGIALGLERRHVESARLLDQALRRFPAGEEADQMKYVLAFVLHQIPENARALEVLEGLLRDHPRSAWVKGAREQIEHIKNPQPDHTH
jgi:tetratricopeptide (TPR) repeat protein